MAKTRYITPFSAPEDCGEAIQGISSKGCDSDLWSDESKDGQWRNAETRSWGKGEQDSERVLATGICQLLFSPGVRDR